MAWSEALAVYPGGGSIDFSTGETNNTTHVTLVSAPSANRRRIVPWVSISNLDSGSLTVHVVFHDTAATPARRVIHSAPLATGAALEWPASGFVELNATTQSLEAVLTGAVAADQPEWMAFWMDPEE